MRQDAEKEIRSPRKLVFILLGIFVGFDSGKLICQLVRLMDQYRQALRTNMKLFALKLQGEKRSFLFRHATI
jgi:hypothetical protein